MSNDATTHTHIFQQRSACRCHDNLFCELEVLGLEDFGVIHIASTALFAEAVHVVPTQPPGDVLEAAGAAPHAEPHIEVRTALVDVLAWAVLPFLADALHEEAADSCLVAEIALLPVLALPVRFVVLARLDFRFIMRVRAIYLKHTLLLLRHFPWMYFLQTPFVVSYWLLVGFAVCVTGRYSSLKLSIQTRLINDWL